MTLKEIIGLVNKVAASQPNIHTVLSGGDIYDLNKPGNINYAAFCAVQRPHFESGDFMTFNFYLYYVDRLLTNESNKVDIQSTAIQVLHNIIKTIESEYYGFEMDNIQYHTFTQSFESTCAGAYAEVSIIIPIDNLCPELF